MAYRDAHGGLLYLCVFHLAGCRALPYQLVEAALLCRAFHCLGVHICGAYCLVGFLRSLRVGVILACLVVFLSPCSLYLFLAGIDAERREVHGVGTHVCYLSVLIEMLCEHHGLRHGESQLACCLLLQCGGGEWRCRCASEGLLRHVAHAECGILAVVEECQRLVVCLEACVELCLHFCLLAVGTDGEEYGVHSIVWLRLECLYLSLSLHDESHCHALHSSGRECRLHLAPQHGRELEAHDAVEHPACLLGIHEVHVEESRMLDGVEDGGLGNLVEHDAVGVLFVESEHLAQMP